MAVYTEIDDESLAALLAEYEIGRALSCKGIAEGVENSNYLLVTETGPHILTLYEKRVKAEDLPFFLGLMDHLAARGFSCPTPIAGRDGRILRHVAGPFGQLLDERLVDRGDVGQAKKAPRFFRVAIDIK